MKATQNEHDVRFLALPNVSDVVRMLENSDQPIPQQRADSIKRRYRNKLEAVRRLQAKAAVLALEACRPYDYRELDRVRRDKIHMAQMEFEAKALEVFSDYCTRGL